MIIKDPEWWLLEKTRRFIGWYEQNLVKSRIKQRLKNLMELTYYQLILVKQLLLTRVMLLRCPSGTIVVTESIDEFRWW